MNALRLVAILLLVGGALALIYGGFTYIQNTHETQIGPVEITVADREHVNIPVWAGIGSLLVGGVLLLFGRKTR